MCPFAVVKLPPQAPEKKNILLSKYNASVIVKFVIIALHSTGRPSYSDNDGTLKKCHCNPTLTQQGFQFYPEISLTAVNGYGYGIGICSDMQLARDFQRYAVG